MHNAIIKHVQVVDGPPQERLFFICPGCKSLGGSGYLMLPVAIDGVIGWTWNGDLDKVTLSPSILTNDGRGNVCHSFLTNGVFEYLSDCTHEYAGQKINMVELEIGVDPI